MLSCQRMRARKSELPVVLVKVLWGMRAAVSCARLALSTYMRAITATLYSIYGYLTTSYRHHHQLAVALVLAALAARPWGAGGLEPELLPQGSTRRGYPSSPQPSPPATTPPWHKHWHKH